MLEARRLQLVQRSRLVHSVVHREVFRRQLDSSPRPKSTARSVEPNGTRWVLDQQLCGIMVSEVKQNLLVLVVQYMLSTYVITLVEY